MTTWITVACVALGSYLYRVVPLFVPRIARPSVRTDRLLSSAAAASVAALIATSWRHQLDGADPQGVVALVLAGGVAALLALRGRPLWLVALVGIALHSAVLAVPFAS